MLHFVLQTLHPETLVVSVSPVGPHRGASATHYPIPIAWSIELPSPFLERIHSLYHYHGLVGDDQGVITPRSSCISGFSQGLDTRGAHPEASGTASMCSRSKDGKSGCECYF